MKAKINDLRGYDTLNKVGDIVPYKEENGVSYLLLDFEHIGADWVCFSKGFDVLSKAESELDEYFKNAHEENFKAAVKAVAEKEFAVPEIEQLIKDGKATTVDNVHPLTQEKAFKYDFINPSHYKKFEKETYEMMIAIWGEEAYIKHCEMCAFKYKLRAGEKPGQSIERDLDKASWYLEMANKLRKK